MMDTVNCFGIPGQHNGWTITQGPDDRFYATIEHSADTWEELSEVLDNLATGSAPATDAVLSGGVK